VFPRTYIRKEWNELLILIQRYITGEGRYNSTSMYHIRLLEHFTGEKPLNLPYFLWKSLTKMAKKVKATPEKEKPEFSIQG
jgi:hypothetical protein